MVPGLVDFLGSSCYVLHLFSRRPPGDGEHHHAMFSTYFLEGHLAMQRTHDTQTGT